MQFTIGYGGTVMSQLGAAGRIILALDMTLSKARALVGGIASFVEMLKVGMQLYTEAGPVAIQEIHASGGEVFLDLKFHDIPNTVAAASAEAVKHGVRMFNVHCLGGLKMMQAARESADAAAKELGRERPLILGVTVLTSLDYPALTEIYPFLNPDLPGEEQDRFIRDFVVHLARLAQKAGLDGVVSSPQEVAFIRAACGPEFMIVPAGIRPLDSAKNDQSRVGTPARAIADGADYLVIGRPITAADDPVQAIHNIADGTAAA
jgi:orotidine-5'-phosphate decarboxylase